MRWSIKIARLAGIDVYLHWTFMLLIGWILFSYMARGAGIIEAWKGVAFVLALIACVVLHELGHALAARKFGVPTRDITLYPIGGVARLARIPEHPLQEFVIAIAGPLVNVVIAVVLGAVLIFLGTLGTGNLLSTEIESSHFLQNLMSANIALVLFNLIPAFPMDGGRMLRAGLAAFMKYADATRIAAGVGQILAILFAVAGIFWLNNPMLVFIAFFIYMGAAGERQLAEARSLLRGIPVRDAMMTRFQTLQPTDSLATAARELLAGVQQNFPVVENEQLVGVLHRSDLAEGLEASSTERKIAELMHRNCHVVSEFDLLESVMMEMQEHDCLIVPVVREGRLVGLIDTENIGELMMIRAATCRRVSVG
jgi:Zn-dependent protease/predicted transcriptional regulator